MKMFATFGSDHLDKDGKSLGKCYLPIEGEDVTDCVSKIHSIRGDKYCTTRHWSEVALYRQRYNTKLVTWEQCTIVEDAIIVEEDKEDDIVAENATPDGATAGNGGLNI